MTHITEELSQKIWQAKLANDMSQVADLISDQAHFVHMGITFDKAGELAAFDNKRFIYQNLELAEEKLEDYGPTVILFKKLILTAQVGEQVVENPFVISEVFSQTSDGWKLVMESYTRIAGDFEAYRFL